MKHIPYNGICHAAGWGHKKISQLSRMVGVTGKPNGDEPIEFFELFRAICLVKGAWPTISMCFVHERTATGIA
ncbi:hypothetical protein [Leeia oryzae]|uniref:hypothetical protein n=1 Tax=Leeia oryzae TaxID=356662 RepID=UPI0012E9EBE5|nr:hypothetical protein [Leeia oryzae]